MQLKQRTLRNGQHGLSKMLGTESAHGGVRDRGVGRRDDGLRRGFYRPIVAAQRRHVRKFFRPNSLMRHPRGSTPQFQLPGGGPREFQNLLHVNLQVARLHRHLTVDRRSFLNSVRRPNSGRTLSTRRATGLDPGECPARSSRATRDRALGLPDRRNAAAREPRRLYRSTRATDSSPASTARSTNTAGSKSRFTFSPTMPVECRRCRASRRGL